MLLDKDKWLELSLRYKFCLYAIKLCEDHGIKLDRAELLSLSIIVIYLRPKKHTRVSANALKKVG